MRVAILLLIPCLLAAQYRTPRAGRSGSSGSAGNILGPAVTFTGKMKEINNKQVIIDSEEEQTVTLWRTHKTHFSKDGKDIKPKDIPVGAPLTIDVNKAPDGALLAVNVIVETPKPAGKPDSK